MCYFTNTNHLSGFYRQACLSKLINVLLKRRSEWSHFVFLQKWWRTKLDKDLNLTVWPESKFGRTRFRRFGALRLGSLLFADIAVLLAPSVRDQFAAECEAAGMRISTSKSKATVLSKRWGLVHEWGENGAGEADGGASAVTRTLRRSVVVKRELSWKAKFLPSPMVTSIG